jgi:hypothetical protein
MRREMGDDDGSPPPLWDPDEGEQLLGTLVRYETRFSQKMNGDVRVAVVEDIDSDDTWSVFLSRSVLKNEFDKQSPRPGDTVGIKYHGRKTARNGGMEYHHYSLRVARAPGSPPPPSSGPSTAAGDDPLDDDMPF